MIIWKLFCFILTCGDTMLYIISKPDTIDNVAGLIGFMLGIAARGCVLYGLATCWLLN